MREYTSKSFYYHKVVPGVKYEHQYHMHVKVPENDLFMPSSRDAFARTISKIFDEAGMPHTLWREASDIFVFAFPTKADAAKARILTER